MRLILSGFILVMAAALVAGPGFAQVAGDSVPELQRLTIDEHLGQKIPLDMQFTDDQGQTVTLAKYFGQGKPVILNLVYFQCPMLCSFVLNGVTDAMKKMDWTPGKQFQLVTVSFNPGETSALGSAKKASYLNDLGKPGADAGWAFLVGPEASSKRLADAVGFKYFYLPEKKEYAHTAATFIISPDGTISRYLYGIEYPERDLRLALLEASEGKIGNTLDRLILYCYHYDPEAKGYVVFATNIMKLGGGIVVIGLGILIGLLWRRERRSSRAIRPALKHL
jgi:protein SCO1